MMRWNRSRRGIICLVLLFLIGAMSLTTWASAQQPSGAAESKKEEEKKWDVNNPPGPQDQVTIDTDEGTWISVDVSPDGNEIIFDLLGGIYTIPIAGGEAKSLTSGVAWDMQPRYSPDGHTIVFTSDRAGGDNIWIMNRDGSNPTQVTKESFRLLNSPVWMPDGQYVAARKHFTSTRSLGAGEIWLYHRTGGEGVQITKKPNDQKDVGEPAFSPDSRYLYFSQDVTPGDIFEYNKDSNRQIYAINRLDRQTGEIEHFIGGPGGAVRPTPSPDRKRLAFIRRVRFKSVLFLYDIESGADWPIYEDLDRDMQETWAIHGVYPNMAWTPDNQSVVFWAGGKIRRINVETRQVGMIPFHVHSTRSVMKALRFPVEVAPERFDVKMLRWVEVSPQGDKVVYQALGYLYIRDLPDGTPRRLTLQTDHFEGYPSFSRDGRWIVYTTWNDVSLGTIRIVSADGGEGRVITNKPGYSVEPVFTPDGKKVVYRKVSGGDLFSPNWSRAPGIYWVSAEGGESTLITKTGIRPHFGASSDRVYLMTFEPEEKRALKSIDLDGSDLRTELISENATEFQVSPDEKWIAFTERFNAFIMPFPKSGKQIEIGPKMKTMPIKKVSQDAGEYLHWSGDSTKLHWALGPELFTRDLTEAFSFVEGAPAELPGPLETGLNIGFPATTDVPSGSIALIGARLITMRGDEVIEDGTALVERNRIKAVGRRKEIKVPSDAHVIDCRGMTIMPGLIDVHAHGGQGANEMVPQQSWRNYASLAFGVTTIHDPSNDTSTIFAVSEMARAGLVVAPRVFSTGTILYGAAGAFKAEIDSLDDARSHIRRMKAVGASSVKSYNQPRRDQRQQVIAAARELGMMVVPEGGSLFQHNMTMVVDGHTGIEHSIPVAKIYKDVIQLWGHSETGYTPTLIVGYGGIWGENYWYQHTNVWENARLLTFVPRFVIDPRSRRRIMAPEEEYNHFNNAQICKQLRDAGVHIQLGAHGQREGLAAHWELWMLVQGGMTPMEALRAGTLDGARYIGLDRDLGLIEAGKLADLVVLERNPLEDIRNSEQIRYTIVNGRIFDTRTMDEIGNHPRKRKPFYWEKEPQH
ncbi:MAG: PD40 domain-containing protein [Acidobacteria bacterium]|nr:PD40 domain-containing protein [Acidobacteriota bacterium]